MTKEEYHKLSKDQKLPLRCPCLNNCARYRYTAYLTGTRCYTPKSSTINEKLEEMNIITSNEDIYKMLDAGEPVTLIGGNSSFLITNGCPEFFLYPHEHKMVGMKNLAVHQYSFDEEYKSDKFKPQGSRHYTECPEYSLFISKKKNLVVRKKIQPKVKMKLQQEIGSKCPFCSNEEVEYFHVHHIDENPTNNNFDNLLMLCQICHSKFTKGDKKTEDAIEMKRNLIRK